MDAGKFLTARVNENVTGGPFRKISIGIYLVDF
jgi:hypothetical protein